MYFNHCVVVYFSAVFHVATARYDRNHAAKAKESFLSLSWIIISNCHGKTRAPSHSGLIQLLMENNKVKMT